MSSKTDLYVMRIVGVFFLSLMMKKLEYFRFGLVWFLCLMAYQLFLGYLMPKPFS